jgi:hypothetical protein
MAMPATWRIAMKKSDADFTRRLIMALTSAIANNDQRDTRAIAEALAKEHGVNLPADWN